MSDERLAISEYSEYRDAINDERLETGEGFFVSTDGTRNCFYLTQRRKGTQRGFINNVRAHDKTRYTLLLHFSHDGHSRLRTMADG